jgi:hypothetical protein
MTIARKTTHDECGGVATGWVRAALGLREMSPCSPTSFCLLHVSSVPTCFFRLVETTNTKETLRETCRVPEAKIKNLVPFGARTQTRMLKERGPFQCRLHGKGLVLVLAALCSVHGAPVEKCEGNCVDGEGTYSFSDGTVYTVCVHQCALKVDPA